MRIRDRLILTAHHVASAIDGLTDHRHLTTDPECVHHVPVKPGSRLDRASRGESCSPCLARAAFDDYEPSGFSEYARVTSYRLFTRDLDITPDEIVEGLAIAAKAGIEGSDAETALFAFLCRLAPTDGPAKARRFLGWDMLALAIDTMLDGLSTADGNTTLARKWGNDGIRIAYAVCRHQKEPHD